MADIGEMNQLTVLSCQPFGYLLDGGKLGDIVLPQSQCIASQKQAPSEGDLVNVFIYRNGQNCLTATEKKPRAVVGEVAYLKVVEKNRTGAFLDWGLDKDLLLPFNEQTNTVAVGEHCLVMVFLDDDYRIAASAKIDEFIEDCSNGEFSAQQSVPLVVAQTTDIGVKVVVNHSHWGVLYHNEIFQPLRFGQKIRGFVKRVRADGKLDIQLQQAGFSQARIDKLGEIILQKLADEGGFLAVNDKTPPELIQRLFATSKKQFKQALGKLYKLRLICIEQEGIYLQTKP